MADGALDSAKKQPKKDDLEEAKKSLKTAIESAKDAKQDNIDEVVNKISKDKDAAFVKNAEEVVKKASEFLEKSEGDAQSGLSTFQTFLNGKSEAKKAVNDNLKHKDGKNYIDAALAHGKKVDKDVAEIVKNNKLNEPTSLSDANAKIKKVTDDPKFMALPEDDAKKKEIKEKVFPRCRLAGKLAESSVQEEKDLAKVVAIFIEKANIDSSFSGETDYKALEENFKKLEKYKSGSNYKNLGADEKTAFDKLFEEVKNKVNKMAKDFKKENKEEPKKPFYKTFLGISLIVVAILVVLAGIA